MDPSRRSRSDLLSAPPSPPHSIPPEARPGASSTPLAAALAVVLLLGQAVSSPAAELLVPEDFPTLAQAVEAAAAGDLISVAPGVYSDPVRLKPDITLRSRGDDTPGEIGLARAEATRIDLGGEQGPAVVMAHGATLDGLTITGAGKFDQELFAHHHATQGEEMGDDGERQPRGAGQAVVLIDGVTAHVRNCIVHDNGSPGIVCLGGEHGASRGEITSNVAFRQMGAGILVAGGAAPLVKGNRCYSNLGPGIGNTGASGHITKNICYDNVRAGIGLSEGSCPVVTDNLCRDNRRAGIGIRSQTTRPIVTGNHCHSNAMAGIGVRDGATPILKKNTCEDNALAGIGIRDGARPSVIENRCFHNAEAGIGVGTGGGGYLGKNECFENRQAGIGLRGEGEVVIQGNQIHRNERAGLGLEACTWGLATILGNRFEENGLVAIGVGSGWRLHASGNSLARTGGLPPLVMIFEGAIADFEGNTFLGSGVAALRVEGHLRAINNTFHCPETRRGGGPPQAATWALPSSSVEFIDNAVGGYGLAILAKEADILARDNQVEGHGSPAMVLADCPGAIVSGNRFLGSGTTPPIQTSGTTAAVEENRWVEGEGATPPDEGALPEE